MQLQRMAGTVSVERAAQRLQLDVRQVYNLIHRGELGAKAFGPRRRVVAEEIERWSKSGRGFQKNRAPSLQSEARKVDHNFDHN
jgi:excisionase family DNA binding protein